MASKKESLVEATILALQGKLKLDESKPTTKKVESVNVDIDAKTSVSVNDNETVVDTEDATVVVNTKETEIVPETPVDDITVDEPPVNDELPTEDEVELPTEDTVEVPVEGDETIVPDEELEVEESKEIKTEKKHCIKYKQDTNKLQEGVEYKDEITSFDELYDTSWSGAIQTLDTVREHDAEDTLMDYLETVFADNSELPTRTEINDFLWFIDEEDLNELIGVEDDEDDEDLEESKKVDEANKTLEPVFDRRSSFYKKAQVDTGDNDDENKLYSYGTLVAEMKDGKPVVYGTYSQTTLRHIKEWLLQNGFEASSKSQIERDYGVKEESKEIKTESQVSNAAENVKNNQRNHTYIDGLVVLVADRVSELAEQMGDDYSEWLGEAEIEDITEIVRNDGRIFDVLDDIIEEAIEDKVAEIRKDDPASKYYEESKKVGNKFSSKTFNEALTNHFKSVYKTVESCNVNKVSINKDSLKIEAKLTTKNKLSKDVSLEMKKVQEGKSFTRYELVNTKGLLRESANDTKLRMMTFRNTDNVLECKYLIRK